MSHNEMCTHNTVMCTADGGPKSICYAKYGIEKVSVILLFYFWFRIEFNSFFFITLLIWFGLCHPSTLICMPANKRMRYIKYQVPYFVFISNSFLFFLLKIILLFQIFKCDATNHWFSWFDMEFQIMLKIKSNQKYHWILNFIPKAKLLYFWNVPLKV